MKKIAVIDYGMGNLMSVQNALTALGCEFITSGDPLELRGADAYILPGVGAFPQAMANLSSYGLMEVLEDNVVTKKKPLLGICLGMQLLADSSQELGLHKGLGWVTGNVVKLEAPTPIRIPHVGWNSVESAANSVLFRGISQGTHFYFDHSYHYVCNDKILAASCHYGRRIVAAFEAENIFATQFHPEKSQNAGLRLMRNYINFVEAA